MPPFLLALRKIVWEQGKWTTSKKRIFVWKVKVLRCRISTKSSKARCAIWHH